MLSSIKVFSKSIQDNEPLDSKLVAILRLSFYFRVWEKLCLLCDYISSFMMFSYNYLTFSKRY